jgi:hypothetical protein
MTRDPYQTSIRNFGPARPLAPLIEIDHHGVNAWSIMPTSPAIERAVREIAAVLDIGEWAGDRLALTSVEASQLIVALQAHGYRTRP